MQVVISCHMKVLYFDLAYLYCLINVGIGRKLCDFLLPIVLVPADMQFPLPNGGYHTENVSLNYIFRWQSEK